MNDVVAAALRAVGCPATTADELATRAHVERVGGDWLLTLLGQGCGIDVPVERATWEEAASVVAENVAASNAGLSTGRPAGSEPRRLYGRSGPSAAE